jgi:hypothetical protein
MRFMGGGVLAAVPRERQVRLLALQSSFCQTSDLDHLRCKRPICWCKCEFGLSSLQTFDLLVQVFEIGLSSLQTSDLLVQVF